jgi:hypothetical protein
VIPRSAEILARVTAVLGFCRAKPTDRVAIYIDSGRQYELGQLFFAAAAAMGCDPVLISGRMRFNFAPPPAGAVEAMRNADIIFDLARVSWLYSPATEQILETGARMLQVRYSDSRLFDSGARETIIPKAKRAGALFRSSSTITIRSGTDSDSVLTMDYTGRPSHPQDGVVETPGEWDSWGTAFCNVCPIETSAEGRVVLNGTVDLLGGSSFITPEPIVVDIHGGRVTKVQGGVSARRFEAYLDSFGDPNSRVLAHAGFGFDPALGPPAKPLGEFADTGAWEPMNAGVIVAFGANKGRKESGGTNAAPTHCDQVLLGADFALGDQQIIQAGRFVVPGFEH